MNCSAAGAEKRKGMALEQASGVFAAADILAVRSCAVDGGPPQLDSVPADQQPLNGVSPDDSGSVHD
jgi:hypothetical protein